MGQTKPHRFTMKTAFVVSALLAMAAGLEINWVVTGDETNACVAPGETINFNWEGPWHNVVELGDDETSYSTSTATSARPRRRPWRGRGRPPWWRRASTSSSAGSRPTAPQATRRLRSSSAPTADNCCCLLHKIRITLAKRSPTLLT